MSEHASCTGDLARGFASVFGAGELAYAAAVLHDMGKARCDWQKGLLQVEDTDEAVGVPHKDLGARLLTTVPGDREAVWAAALMVWGHHGGLRTLPELKAMVRQAGEADDEDAVRRFLDEVPQARAVLAGPLVMPQAWSGKPHVRELGVRLTYSALVDADFLDTSVHFGRTEGAVLGSGVR